MLKIPLATDLAMGKLDLGCLEARRNGKLNEGALLGIRVLKKFFTAKLRETLPVRLSAEKFPDKKTREFLEGVLTAKPTLTESETTAIVTLLEAISSIPETGEMSEEGAIRMHKSLHNFEIRNRVPS